jgi:hypothetical protein
MHEMDLDRLEKVEEGLALFFYLFMFVALVAALDGSIGSGLVVLIVGSCAHVGRATLAEFIGRERARGSGRDARPVPVAPPRTAPVDRGEPRPVAAAAVRRG